MLTQLDVILVRQCLFSTGWHQFENPQHLENTKKEFRKKLGELWGLWYPGMLGAGGTAGFNVGGTRVHTGWQKKTQKKWPFLLRVVVLCAGGVAPVCEGVATTSGGGGGEYQAAGWRLTSAPTSSRVYNDDCLTQSLEELLLLHSQEELWWFTGG